VHLSFFLWLCFVVANVLLLAKSIPDKSECRDYIIYHAVWALYIAILGYHTCIMKRRYSCGNEKNQFSLKENSEGGMGDRMNCLFQNSIDSIW